MNGLRHAATRAPSTVQSGPVARLPYGRTAVYRRLQQQTQRSNLHSFVSNLSRSTITSYTTPLRSKFLPDEIQIARPVSSSRGFHQGLRLGQQEKTKAKTEEPKESAAEGESAKKASGESGEEKAKDQSEGASEGEGEGKKEDKKEEAAPPPPPHGDKSPWQVFTETLQSEFKASKEWNESTKALAAGAQQFTENESVRRARQAYESTTGAVTSSTAKVLKTTAGVVGKGAAWTWETPVVKGVRSTVNATASVIEKGTRPIRETEAYKNVKNVIDDGSSSRYGGWVEKEERRKARELRELKEAQASGHGRRAEVPKENPDAGTNITVHKDAAWKESWREFRDSSKMMQSLFSLKSAYNESENPLISTARSISDRIAGFFAENETALVIKKFREMDPSFQMEPFIQEMREYILPEVLDAYVKGDTETLRLWLSAAQFQVYDALSKQYTTAGLKSDGRILDIRNVEILSARILDPGDIPVFIVTCRTQEVHVYRNAKTNQLAAGMEDKVQLVTYAIGVTRVAEDVNNPETRGWRLIELQKSGRDYI
ncbi:hypothetical protein M430DRAFT_49756 [Amorphotheca resinae ATCC 22711]|uniref:Mitochondrial import inner membrane translocase subunit TIM44 n=1 Tax=Amorphotheca resinae ATCC 22711 TaxID=857342 RepID=A0A2T3B330_AMORE|nr:hypothetical protein M430DRAFT_49756 [Amorphotheca resinae ATCC 22711]PSS20046.1 hypothetical protein M430DRAFT_49756 [Amorphotheca resinae ATCC 22711]